MKETVYIDIEKYKVSQINEAYFNNNIEEFYSLCSPLIVEQSFNPLYFDVIYEILIKSLSIVKNDIHKNEKRYIVTLINLGSLANTNQEYTASLQFAVLALIYAHKLDFPKSILLTNIGAALEGLNQSDKALEYCIKAEEEFNKNEISQVTEKNKNLTLFRYQTNKISLNLQKRKFNKIKNLLSYSASLIKSFSDDISHENQAIKTHKAYTLLIEAIKTNKFQELFNYEDELISLNLSNIADEINVSLVLFIDDKNFHILEPKIIEIIEKNTTISPIRKKTFITELIDIYNKKGEIEKARIYAHKLYVLEKERNQKKNTGNFLGLFTNELQALFSELKRENELTHFQKNELEELTYILSHDLKTPLRTINSFSSLIQRNLKRKNYENLATNLKIMNDSSKTLYELIEDVNQLYRFNDSVKKTQLINLNDVANETLYLMKDAYPNILESVIITDNLPNFNGHYENFKLLFSNLIENSLKFNKSLYPQVTISSIDTPKSISLIFEDNGIGIEEEFQQYIFKYFKRLHTKEEYEGSGIGLALCKKIADFYRGSIKVEAVKSNGSKFIIELKK